MTAGKYMFSASNYRALCARINPGRNTKTNYGRNDGGVNSDGGLMVNYAVIHRPEMCTEVY